MKSECRNWKKRLEEMRSESTNIHEESEISDVVLMSHEEEVPICRKILEDQDNVNEDENEPDQVFFMIRQQMKPKEMDNFWIADSGASCLMTNLLEDMIDLKNYFSQIKIGSGKTM